MVILLILFIIIFLVPTFNIGGVPIRVEDLLFIILIVKYYKNDGPDVTSFLRILYLILISYFLSYVIQYLSGYNPVIQDMNTVFSLLRNIVIFLAGVNLGKSLIISDNQLFICIAIGFFICSIVSIIQFYDIGGLGIITYLMFGSERGVEYGINRTVGIVGNPNYAAFFQICGIISILSIKKVSKISKIIMTFLLILSVVSVYVTFSRTGLLALILCFLTYLIVEKRFLILLSAVILSIISLPFLYQALKGTRYEKVISGKGTELITLNGRVDSIWEKKLNAFYDNPIFGITTSGGSASNTMFDVAIFDNSFLYLLVVSGIIGLFLYLAFHYFVIKRFIYIKKRNFLIYMALLHTNIFVFYLTTDLVKGVMFTSYYFFIVGLFISLNPKQPKYETTNKYSNFKLE